MLPPQLFNMAKAIKKKKQPEEVKYMTIKELAEYASISTSYLYKSKSTIPHLRIGGKIMFEKTEIDKWLESKKVKVN